MAYKVLARLNAKREYNVGEIIELDDLAGFEALYLANGSIELIEEIKPTKEKETKPEVKTEEIKPTKK